MKSKLLSLENKLRFPDYKNKQGMNELVFESGELFIHSAKQSLGTSYIKQNKQAHSTHHDVMMNARCSEKHTQH